MEELEVKRQCCQQHCQALWGRCQHQHHHALGAPRVKVTHPPCFHPSHLSLHSCFSRQPWSLVMSKVSGSCVSGPTHHHSSGDLKRFVENLYWPNWEKKKSAHTYFIIYVLHALFEGTLYVYCVCVYVCVKICLLHIYILTLICSLHLDIWVCVCVCVYVFRVLEVFPRWVMCWVWPFVHILWDIVCSDPLPVFALRLYVAVLFVFFLFATDLFQFLLYFWSQFTIGDMISKHILPFCALPFHFGCFLHCAQVFKFGKLEFMFAFIAYDFGML